MKGLLRGLIEYCRGVWDAWDAFLFTPTDPATLCLIRVLAGAMLLYTHAIWTNDLGGFFGSEGYLPQEVIDASHQARFVDPENPRWTFSYFDYLSEGWLLWLVHSANLVVFFCLMIGLFSRTMAVIACMAALSYATRVTPGAFFGLDKINCLLALYLTLGPCGARYSIDRLWALRRQAKRGGAPPMETPPSISANVAIRLIQMHMCVVYLFSGLGKLQGIRWWDGSATWFAIASTEYRSLDMTWLAGWIPLVEFLTHATIALELFYCCLVWNRWTRPWVLLGAISMHAFIGGAMGMITFALVMIFGNLAFFRPVTVRRFCDPIARRVTLALVGEPAPTEAT
ncbi:MAG: HTTM domain-containing protein [Planctomycetota bacterium]